MDEVQPQQVEFFQHSFLFELLQDLNLLSGGRVGVTKLDLVNKHSRWLLVARHCRHVEVDFVLDREVEFHADHPLVRSFRLDA